MACYGDSFTFFLLSFFLYELFDLKFLRVVYRYRVPVKIGHMVRKMRNSSASLF
jgi:hypothetical protein